MGGAARRAQHDSIPLTLSARATWVAIGVTCLLAFVVPVPPGSRGLSLLFGAAVVLYSVVVFHLLGRRWEQYRRLGSGRIFAMLAFLAAGEVWLRPLGINLDPFYFPPIISIGLASGSRGSLAMATAASLLVASSTLVWHATLQIGPANVLILVAALYLSALVVAELRGQILRQFVQQRSEIQVLQRQAEQRAEQMAVLHRLGREISSSLDANAVCREIHAGVAELVPCDAFSIARYDAAEDQCEYLYASGDEERERRVVARRAREATEYVIRSRQPLLLASSQPQPGASSGMLGPPGRFESLICVPMIVGERVIGALAAQSRRPAAYDRNDLELLQLLAAQASIALENACHYGEAQDNATRLAVLNRVAQLVTSTLEMARVMELIHEQVSRVIVADSYFLATYNESRGELHFEFLIDGGKQFPPQTAPVGNGLSWWVLSSRRPLLLTCVPEQVATLGIEPGVTGEQRLSQSWLGVPLLTGETLIGLLAVASYETNKFGEADLRLLQNIAQLAAIALDNARRHAEVKQQARLDSLTQVYNHGYFVTRLTQEVERARAGQRMLSLIMLDIDYFKQYNDTFGHRTGDEVLRATVAAIRAHIKHSDFVGRWGGEEFGIVLLNASTPQAMLVAERISATLRQVRMLADDGRRIETPTVSQGLATMPTHASDVDTLISLADQALYKAKRAGRDQICVSPIAP